MQTLTGILCCSFGFLYLGQLITVVNLSFAQRLGLQEHPDNVDPLHSRLELWTARWALLWLWILPVVGILMLIDHPFWPYLALIGGGATVDTGGREAAKVLGLRRYGVRTGSPTEQRLAMMVFGYMFLVGALTIVVALLESTGK